VTTSTTPAPRAATTPATTHGRRPPHRADRRLIVAALLVLLGAVTPWIDTVAGNVLGVQGGGLYTLAAGGIGLAGAFLPHRRVVLAHAVVLAATPLVIGGWQAARLVAIGCDFRVCAPSFGLVLTLLGGGLAAVATRRLAADPGAPA
jgi:hypothetical protein